jgi:4'-phosphopantetheinyl transferase
MPLLSIDIFPDYQLIVWAMDESLIELQGLVPEPEFHKIEMNTRLEKRKIEKLGQYLLLKNMGIAHSEVYYDKNGKPLLSSGKHISFTHSGNLSAMLLSNTNCGIDLEIQTDKILRIAKKFLNVKEKEMMKEKENVFWAWSIKEVVFKYFGERVLFKDHITILEINKESKKALVEYDGFHGKGIFEIKIDRIKNYYLAFTNSFTSK